MVEQLWGPFDAMINKITTTTGLSTQGLIVVALGVLLVWTIISAIQSKSRDRKQIRKQKKEKKLMIKQKNQEIEQIQSSDFYRQLKQLFYENQITIDTIASIQISLTTITCEKMSCDENNKRNFMTVSWDLNELGFKSVNPNRLVLFRDILFNDYNITKDRYEIINEHMTMRTQTIKAYLKDEQRRAYIEANLKQSI